jgi:hypothetical protein
MGNSSGAGMPPANEIISGRWITLSNSRTADRRIRVVRSANKDFQFIQTVYGAAANSGQYFFVRAAIAIRYASAHGTSAAAILHRRRA